MSLNVKTPEMLVFSILEEVSKLKGVIGGEWAWYFTMVWRIAHEGGNRKKY